MSTRVVIGKNARMAHKSLANRRGRENRSMWPRVPLVVVGQQSRLHRLPVSAPPELHSTNPIERVEKSRAAPRSASSPNDEVIIRLVGAILVEQNDKWAVQRVRYMTLETMDPLNDDPWSSCPPWPPDKPARPAGDPEQLRAPTP
jgi:hypothetical protein